ncbi:Single-stranded DNA-binding protein [compost metagenome]
MNKSRNSVRLVGFTGSDLSVNYFEDNRKVARVNVAINERYKTRNGEESRQTQWFSLVFWNAKADEALKIIKKGAEIEVEGKLVCQTYVTKDGQKRYSTEIIVQRIHLAARLTAKPIVTEA